MGKKIMILTASPKKEGNTNAVVEWIKQGAGDNAAEIEKVNLAELDYKVNGCIACMGCQQSDKFECVIKDEASPILARIPKVDTLVMATPLYFFGPSAQLKLFLDRMFSLFKFDPNTGKYKHNLEHVEFAVVCTAGGDDLKALDQMFKAIFAFIGKECQSLLIANAGNSGDIKTNTDVQRKAMAFGRNLSLRR